MLGCFRGYKNLSNGNSIAGINIIALKKSTIFLIIDDLGKGGAEMLLVGILQDLRQSYNVILITLNDNCAFDDAAFNNVTRHSLGVKNKLHYFPAIVRLKRLIKKYKPALVHSHLVYSSIIARLACPANIPLLFSVHNEIGSNVFNASPILRLLEKKTIKKRHTLIAVSNAVLEDYGKAIHFEGDKIVLPNYISDEFYLKQYEPVSAYQPGETLRVVALGNIKKSKNYEYLVESFKQLKGYPVTIDIYGKKDETIYPVLQSVVSEHDLPVLFKGIASDIPRLFSHYHLYIMSSIHEGFGIAVVEAMASGLPLLLSDLKALREVTGSNALFFDLKDSEAMAVKIKEILDGNHDLAGLSLKGLGIAKNYSKQIYLQKLNSIYAKLAPSL